ncbi:MAG: YciI family protein [Gemmatimonadales bacterium]
MRFMMLMIPRVYQPSTPAAERAGPDFMPPADAVARMMKYNEELAKAGALVALDGLHPLQEGARISFRGGKPSTTDGPFIEAKEVLGGYWIIDVKSREQAVEWARRVPADEGDVIEVRQIFEVSEFPPDVQEVVASSPIAKEFEHQGGVNRSR